VVDAVVAIVVTLAMGLAVLGGIPVALGLVLMLLAFIPYVGFLMVSPTTIARLSLPNYIRELLVNASREAGAEGMAIEAELEELGPATSARSWRPVELIQHS
jgi:hypothetical protein